MANNEIVKLTSLANQFLDYLYARSQPAGQALTTLHANDWNTRTKTWASLETKFKKLGLQADNNTRIYPYSTLVATIGFKEYTEKNILPSEFKEILTLLKDHNRIIQIGAGRGIGVAIASYQYLEADPLVKLIDPTDPKALLKALQEQVVNSESDKAAYENLLKEKEKELVEAKKKVEQLSAEVASASKISWT